MLLCQSVSMDARQAIRRGLARAIDSDDFNPSGIPGIEAIRKDLAPEIQQLQAEARVRRQDFDVSC